MPRAIDGQDDTLTGERVSGKGELTRKRTVVGELVDGEEAGFGVVLDVDERPCCAAACWACMA